MARPAWKGYLKLSLITIPIRVFPATNPHADVSFRQLHRKCHTPIQLKKWCPHCHKEVAPGDIVKGYESAKGQFVLVEEEEIAQVRPSSTHMVEITHMIEASAIDPILIERAYYLAPESTAAGSPFAVLRDALGDRAGVGYLALHGREYLVAVLPRAEAFVLYTLRTAGEVRNLKSVDGLDFAEVRVKPEEVKLARQVLNGFKTAADLSAFTDHYQEALRTMLKSKGMDDTIAVAERGAPAKVVNLMDALRQSLAKVTREKKQPARAGSRKGARVLAHPSSRKGRKAS